MASIVEAFDSTMKEAFTGIKIFLWAIPVCFAYTAGTWGKAFLIPILTVLLIGFAVQLANNVIVKTSVIVPGINLIKIAIVGIMSLLCMAPYAIAGGLIYWLLSLIKIPSAVWNTTYDIVIALFAISFPLTACIIYMRRLNILEIFNMKKYFTGFWEVFLSASFLLVKLALWSIIVIGFIYYLFSMFVGFSNWFWYYILSSVFIFYLILSANYLAQISEEIYTFPEKEEAKKKEQAAMSKLGK